ncbi:MAG: enoyl-CoA hydratase/isomerase family protein [Solirubrobacteraceae bacterium]
MTDEARALSQADAIPHVPFEAYRETFERFFHLDRSASGVLTARMHTDGGPVVWSLAIHRAIHQLTTMVGQDAETEVFVFGGTGDEFVATLHEELAASTVESLVAGIYDNFYYDGANICEGLVSDVEVPTIGVINGPGFHTELALLCDITIASDDAVIIDPHLPANLVPGDGIQTALRAALGYKRATYAMLTSQAFDAQSALEAGLVNEVHPKDRVYERAREIAEDLARRPRTVRRITTQVLRAPLKEALTRDLRGDLGQELFALLASMADPDTARIKSIMDDLGGGSASS